jgi:uncharacterized protein (TIGR03067 family)
MQGTWKAESEVIEGAKTPAELLTKMIIKGDKLIYDPKAKDPAVRIKLDPSKKPAAIDLIDGDDTTFGIYQLDGDTLKICWEDFRLGLARPKAFEATKENRYLVLKREKK